MRSVHWDLGIPQHAASVLYEDNDACTAMAMAQWPTPRTRHMDIKYQAICEWVERDLIHLKWIDTTINLADLFTKQLGATLFYRHLDYIHSGHVPPHYFQTAHPTSNTGSGGFDGFEGSHESVLTTALVWTQVALNPFAFTQSTVSVDC